MFADGSSSDFSGKDVSLKKKEFFYSVFSVQFLKSLNAIQSKCQMENNLMEDIFL